MLQMAWMPTPIYLLRVNTGGIWRRCTRGERSRRQHRGRNKANTHHGDAEKIRIGLSFVLCRLNRNAFGMVGQFPDFCDGLCYEYVAILENCPQEITRVLMLIGNDLR